jgi:hypothetical protein
VAPRPPSRETKQVVEKAGSMELAALTSQSGHLNAVAASIVADSVDEDKAEPTDDAKDPAAVALGRRGGLKGGKARAENLTPEQRSEIAREAATVAGWADR